jgi:hypothetical protein
MAEGGVHRREYAAYIAQVKTILYICSYDLNPNTPGFCRLQGTLTTLVSSQVSEILSALLHSSILTFFLAALVQVFF